MTVRTKMKWLGKLKQIGSRVSLTSSKDEATHNYDPLADKKRAMYWLAVAIIMAMPIVAHVYTLLFNLYSTHGRQPKPWCENATDSTTGILLGSVVGGGGDDDNVTAPVVTSKPPGFYMNRTFWTDFVAKGPMIEVNGTMVPDPVAVNASQVDIKNTKYVLFAGQFSGSLLVGPFAGYFGRKASFKILTRTLILAVLLLSLCKTIYILDACWFLVGSTMIALYTTIFVEVHEKFDYVIVNQPRPAAAAAASAEAGDSGSALTPNFSVYKLRTVVGLMLTSTWSLARLLILLIAWFTRDWTHITLWFGIILAFVYFVFGDFFVGDFIDEEKEDKDKPVPDEESNLFKMLYYSPIMSLNLFILVLNWFVTCHNLHGLVMGWVNFNSCGTMIDNTSIASSFSFISIPICIAVCIASRRKLLPYGLLQLFVGIIILLMIVFQKYDPKDAGFSTWPIIIAHVSNVLDSAAFSILWVMSVEIFPRKYRIHCMGICSAAARVGTMVGVTLNEMLLFRSTTGPAFAGGLSIIVAILSRLLPDSSSHKMLETQQEIERVQFPSLMRSAATTPSVQPLPCQPAANGDIKRDASAAPGQTVPESPKGTRDV